MVHLKANLSIWRAGNVLPFPPLKEFHYRLVMSYRINEVHIVPMECHPREEKNVNSVRIQVLFGHTRYAPAFISISFSSNLNLGVVVTILIVGTNGKLVMLPFP